jgi:Domain of unknown function (DUF1877)
MPGSDAFFLWDAGVSMGVTAGLIRYPAEVFEQVKAQRTFYPPNDLAIQHCFLDRSWDEIHPALRSFGAPLSLALSGDYGFAGGLDRFGWDAENDCDHYLGFVSPPLVADIAAHLRELPFEQLAKKLTEPSRGFDYIAPQFAELVEFYATAAADGNCVFVHAA